MGNAGNTTDNVAETREEPEGGSQRAKEPEGECQRADSARGRMSEDGTARGRRGQWTGSTEVRHKVWANENDSEG